MGGVESRVRRGKSRFREFRLEDVESGKSGAGFFIRDIWVFDFF